MSKIELKHTKENIELVKAMASSDPATAMAAREAFAAVAGKVILQVLNLRASAPLIYKDWQFSEENDNVSIPLDMFYNKLVDNVTVWQQTQAGGLGSSLVTGLQELKISTYTLDTAVSFLERNIKNGTLPVVSLGLNRAAQELLAKQEANAFLIVLKALGESSTNGTSHVIAATTANVLQLDDFNRLITRSKRINLAFNGGTPDAMYSKGATDLFMSPEMIEQIRGFAYQPMNTRVGTMTTSGATAVALPDSVRTQIYNSGGDYSIYGVNIHEMLELGDGTNYNLMFKANYAGSFTAASDQIILGVDTSRGVVIRPVATDAETGGQLVMQVDDQFTKRSKRIGFFGGITEGRCVLDARALTGLTV